MFGLGLPVGIPIIFSENALEEVTERLFPESRHRSKRVHKKLVKRFGGEFRKVPAIFKTPQGFIAHPKYQHDIYQAFKEKQ